MKKVIFALLSLITFSLDAQVEITNLDTVRINESDSPQHITLNVKNNSVDSIDLDWEIEFTSNVESFLQISVSDINNDYTPQIHSSCDLTGITNILEASESYPMGLHFTLDEVPSTFDKNSPFAYFNLYIAEECTGANLLSIPIMFGDGTTGSVEISKHATINLYPNPSNDYIFLTHDKINARLNFKIFDIQLKQVMKGVIENDVIDISNLVSGQYVVRVDNQNLLFIKK